MLRRRLRLGRIRDRRPGVGGDRRERPTGAEARELLVGVGNRVAHDEVRLGEAIAILPQLIDVRAQRVASAVQVRQDALAERPGLGDHLPAPFARGLDDGARILVRLLELLGADARRFFARGSFDPRRLLTRPLRHLLGRLLGRTERAGHLLPHLLHELVTGRQGGVPQLTLEVGEPPVQRVELVGHDAKEGAHLPLVEALPRSREILPLDLGGCQPGLVRAGRARLVRGHRRNCIGAKGRL